MALVAPSALLRPPSSAHESQFQETATLLHNAPLQPLLFYPESFLPDSPLTRSPAKTKKHKQEDADRESLHGSNPAAAFPSQHMRPLEVFPATAQPATITDLKEKLLSLRESLHIDMSTATVSPPSPQLFKNCQLESLRLKTTLVICVMPIMSYWIFLQTILLILKEFKLRWRT